MIELGLLWWIGTKLEAPTLYYALVEFLMIVKVITFGVECYKKGAE